MSNRIPKRVQRKRTKDSKLSPNTLCCTRPGFWSNPFIGKDAAKWFRYWLLDFPEDTADQACSFARIHSSDLRLHQLADPHQTACRYLDNLEELRQYDYLGCWCGPDDDCHVDTYLKLLGGE